MPVDLGQWTGDLALTEVDEKPAQVLVVKYGSLEIDELGKVLTPTQVVCYVNLAMHLLCNTSNLSINISEDNVTCIMLLQGVIVFRVAARQLTLKPIRSFKANLAWLAIHSFTDETTFTTDHMFAVHCYNCGATIVYLRTHGLCRQSCIGN